MKKFKKFLKQGASLKVLNYIMLGMAIIITIILLIAMQQTTLIYEETHNATRNLFSLRKSAYELQQASDYLTEQIRYFVTSGDKAYLDDYFEEANTTKRRDNALSNLKANQDDTVAFYNLNEAMRESLDLMNDEYYAARLIVDANGYDISTYPEEIQNVTLPGWVNSLSSEDKKKEAENIVFGKDYQRKKDTISTHMQTCLTELEDEMGNKQSEMADKMQNQVTIEHVLTVLLIIIMLVIVLLTTSLVIRPLGVCIEKIRDDEDIPVKGAYEIKFLAKTYNLMHQTNLAKKKKLTYEATHDKLTGLYNRRGYDFLMENLELESCALLLIDLDKFKNINDEYGHDIGDKILIKASDSILGNFRSQDYICRIGGDEIAVIMVNADTRLSKLITKKVRRINETLLSTSEEDNLPPISISVGVAFGDDGITRNDIFKRADEALYTAKEKGRNEVSFYSS